MKRKTTILGLIALSASTLGCSVGQGEGWVFSERLVVDECWTGAFDLEPDFFASVPYRNTQQIRIQHGSDLQEVSDGVAILVNDVPLIRDSMLGQQLEVGLPAELWSEVNPGAGEGAAPLASLALYLQFSCHSQNTVQYAIRGTIMFTSLFSNDPNEKVGQDKLTEAEFDVVVADPREALQGSTEVPEERTSHLRGYFRYHFLRGQPGQPFP